MLGTFYLEMVLFGDQHGLQGIQSTLLLFVGYEDSSFLAVKRSVNTGHSPELKKRTIIQSARAAALGPSYLAKYVPNITFRETLVVDECDGVVAKLVSLNITWRSQTETVVATHQLYQSLLCAGFLLVANINVVPGHIKQARASHVHNLAILTKVLQNLQTVLTLKSS